MRHIAPPAIDSASEYARILKYAKDSRKKTLSSIQENILAAYALYDNGAPEFAGQLRTQTLSSDEEELLRKVYDTQKQNLRNAILMACAALTRAMSPCCGIGEPSTLDHVLARSNFPEFSIHTHNLVPHCSVCNEKKGSKFRETTGHRSFINCYYDDINQYPFLQCDVLCNAAGVPLITFAVKKPDTMPDLLFVILENHFRNLDLSNRYLMRVEHRVEQDMKSDTAVLREKVRDAEGLYGKNHWETAYFQGLINFQNTMASRGA